VRLIILKLNNMQDYVTDDLVLIWQLLDNVAVDDADILHVKRRTSSGS
jgi:hypothetical protein